MSKQIRAPAPPPERIVKTPGPASQDAGPFAAVEVRFKSEGGAELLQKNYKKFQILLTMFSDRL
jgi:hypothetical protein